MSKTSSRDILDVAIVGGGVAGLYSAWRLAHESGGRTTVTVFEGSDRIGGRLLSVTPPGMPNTRCELGGMRYMSRHALVSTLVKRFKFETQEMPVYDARNVAYLRGKQLRLGDLSSPSAVPYNLRVVEQNVLNQPNGSLLLFALQQIVPNCLAIEYDQLLEEMKTATFDGTPLHQLGFWNVLARILSPDAYSFVRDTSGYDCLVSNWSAADAIPFILADFGQGVTYFRFPGGYIQLPLRLRKEFEKAGGKVTLGAWLRSFDTAKLPDGTDGVELRFADGTLVYARRLVLAMPRRSLELLEPTGVVLDRSHSEVRALIESVEPIPLFKIFLCYEYPWWKAIDVSVGRSITDMPIRQCYYWNVEPRTPTMDGNSCMLASYDDDLSVTFWAGLRGKTESTPLWTSADHVARNGGDVEGDDWKNYLAPKAMVEEAHRQVVQMHGISYAPMPYAAAYRDWAEDPYGGGVNFWRIHAKSWEVLPAIINPRPGLPVFICGEAYSHEQGWVEGSLQTAELMLQQHFNLKALPVEKPTPGASSSSKAKERPT